MTNWFTTFRDKGREFQELPSEEQLSDFQEFLGRTSAESFIMAWLCMNYKKREGKSVNLLFEKLTDKFPAEKLTEAFINLIALGLVQINIDDYGAGGFSILFTHRVEVALRTGSADLLKKKIKNQNEDDRITLRMYGHALLFRAKITDVDAWISMSKVFLHYFDTDFSKMTRSTKLDRLSQAAVLYIYVIHAVEGCSTEFSFLTQLFSENKMEARRLLFQWKRPEWKPIQTGLLDVKQYPMGPMALLPSERVQQRVYGLGDKKLKAGKYLPPSLEMIPAKNIIARKLFFNPTESEQIELFQQMMIPANFNKFQRTINEKNRAIGISVLLSGGPGTGKTELARQAARMSGRDLIIFNVAEQRDKYFGESEKRIKQVFECYEDIVNSGSRMPILFFNEADSVFQTRLSNGSSTSSTENTIQTILLNELEQFNGILICTTNRPDSFDVAFSRRFDFKIDIHPPTAAVRMKLLKHLYANIPPERMALLAERYSFTGAELGNFYKIYCMQSIVKKKDSQQDFAEALENYLASTLKKPYSSIGFNAAHTS